MTEDRLVSLITRRMSGDLGPQELLELEEWGDIAVENRRFLDRATSEALLEKEVALWNNIDPAIGHARWVAYRQARLRSRILQITGWSVAASLLIAIAVGVLSQKSNRTAQPVPAIAMTNHQVVPGRNTATLTLSNGQEILLDSVAKGELGKQGNTRILKAGNGRLSYLTTGKEVAATTYNILTTPRSGQYQLKLPDGTQVWLNNVSSLRYPTSFQGKERTVELSGEAYFEVAKDDTKPFVVKVREEVVEVLGTSFNVMDYPEEGGTQTTLLTGRVQVKVGNALVQLKPDEQAQVKAGGGLKVIKDVASRDIVSWKDGFFYFGRASFSTVMRQLARWYDVEVVYEGKIPEMEFGGKIDRSLPLNDLLKYLDTNHIHFRLDEGRKLIVLPN